MKSKYKLPNYPLYRIGEDGNLYSIDHQTIGRQYIGKRIKLQAFGNRYKLWMHNAWITPARIEEIKVIDDNPIILNE